MRAKGERYRPIVQILKMKKGIPTVIRVSGHEYALRPENQYSGGKQK